MRQSTQGIEQTEPFFYTTPKGDVTFIGDQSDICKALREQFKADGWQTWGWNRRSSLPMAKWNLLVVGVGVLDPIGRWTDLEDDEWEQNVESNCFVPLRLLRRLWKYRLPNSAVCFFSGAGVSRQARTYSAYAASKLMLMKMTELLDDEEPSVKFFILGPGMLRTKIQAQTMRAGLNAENFERVHRFMDVGDPEHGAGTDPKRIYECLRWCMAQPKGVIGGRNVYVPTDGWDKGELAAALERHPNLFKLRRLGDGQY